MRKPTGERLIHSDPERVLVVPGADRAPERHFRGHVVGTAGRHPGRRQTGVRGPQRLRDAEVGKEHVPVLVEEHVGGLDVAVHHPTSMDGVERAGHRGQPRRHLTGREPTPGGRDTVLEAPAAEELEHRKGDAFVNARVGDCHDPGMVEGEEAADLLLEAGGEARLVQVARVRHLEHDPPGEPAVRRKVRGAHPTGAEDPFDLVPPLKDLPGPGCRTVRGLRIRHG